MVIVKSLSKCVMVKNMPLLKLNLNSNILCVTARRAMSTDYTVHTQLGVVKGQKKTSKAFSKKEYYSFLGIPYARPPIGNLRFKDPQPPEEWQGVLDCAEDPQIAPQNHFLLNHFVGDEDCLKLNVFTCKLPNAASSPKPVMVWLHGGGFTFGSGNTDFYGPDYLIEQDVVIVNVNYRLGALGFLSLGNADVPGNAGLKDQLMALRWVQQNISAFGGDPKNVTLFGESAGGTSCHLHMLSPLSRGLYHRVIIQSGSCLNPWAFTLNAKERAFRLAKALGCKSADPVEIIEFLRKVPAEDIVKNQRKALTRQEKSTFVFPFVPSIEVPGTGNNFLTKHPREALEEGDFARVPLIIGINSKEGLLLLNGILHNDEYFKLLNKDIGRVISPNIGLPIDNLQNTVQKIKKFYFGEKDLSWDTLDPYLDYLGDLLFAIGVDQVVHIQLEKANVPIYFYKMAYEGPKAYLKAFISMKYPDHPNLPGVCHADDLSYIFYPHLDSVSEFVQQNTTADRVTSQITKMWCEFAKSGNPNGPGIRTTWESCKSKNVCHLEINEQSNMRYSRIFEDRMLFWDSLLNFPLKQKL